MVIYAVIYMIFPPPPSASSIVACHFLAYPAAYSNQHDSASVSDSFTAVAWWMCKHSTQFKS
jgi:hypothetical protein